MVANIAVAADQGDQAPCTSRDFPEDLRAVPVHHSSSRTGPGMFGELVPPLVLLFSHNHVVTVMRGRCS